MSSSYSRRGFLKGAGSVAAGLAASGTVSPAESAPSSRDPGKTVLPYPRAAIAKYRSLAVDRPVEFHFPDAASPCVLIRRPESVSGGVGPDRSLIAFSTTCTHMGCPVEYQARSATFKCPCHFTTFDAEREGQMICGQATENLPRIVLEHDEKSDSIYAVAVVGLLYGRQSNIL